ncbi:t-SNARE, partial [Blyttiomyces helicus]
MARDRLKDIGAGSHQTVVEMEGLMDTSAPSLDSFYDEVNRMKDDIESARRSVLSIEEMQRLGAVGLDKPADREQLERLSNMTQDQLRGLRDRIKQMILQTQRLAKTQPRDAQLRRNQQAYLLESIQEVTRNFHIANQTAQDKYKEQLGRQYRIVRPDATDAEVAEAVERGDGAFSREILASRLGQQQQNLEEVKSRQAQLKQIFTAITELAKLLEDMQEMIDAQQ